MIPNFSFAFLIAVKHQLDAFPVTLTSLFLSSNCHFRAHDVYYFAFINTIP